MEEQPLIRGDAYSSLPPLSAFAAVAASIPLVSAPEIGGTAWPRESTFDTHLFGLLLAFIDSGEQTQLAVLDSSNIQSEMEKAPSAGLPSAGPSELSALLADRVLRERGPPWLAEEWNLPSGVPTEGLIARLLRIFAVNAMPFAGGGALYKVASKLAHRCHGANVDMVADAERGLGVFRALRDIEPGDLLSHPYLTLNLSLFSAPLRRRLLYCQRGMFCACASCTGTDWLRQLPSACGGGATVVRDGVTGRWRCRCERCGARAASAQLPAHDEATDEALAALLLEEEVLAGKALEMCASIDVEKPRRLPELLLEELERLLGRCEAVLGAQHASTQALRRLSLMQEYETIGRSERRGEWVQRLDACQAWIDEMLERCHDWMAAAELEAQQRRRKTGCSTAREHFLSKVQHEIKGEVMGATVKIEERLEREIGELAALRAVILGGGFVPNEARVQYSRKRKLAIETRHNLAVQREVATGQVHTDAADRWTIPSPLEHV
eukprot:jgi/Chrpa1/8860/Chrysochromulina_OHIO_Genome00004146-RA